MKQIIHLPKVKDYFNKTYFGTCTVEPRKLIYEVAEYPFWSGRKKYQVEFGCTFKIHLSMIEFIYLRILECFNNDQDLVDELYYHYWDTIKDVKIN